jgi:hypothetical protein
MKARCAWPKNALEGAQAGLSWDTILAKCENYRRANKRGQSKFPLKGVECSHLVSGNLL